MDSKQDFYYIIYDYYFKVVDNKFPSFQLEELCNRITDYYYDQYTRFREKYPKSLKRYSSFQIKDLDHPETFEIIINFLKEKMGNNYPNKSMLILDWSLDELMEFEKNRNDFHNK